MFGTGDFWCDLNSTMINSLKQPLTRSVKINGLEGKEPSLETDLLFYAPKGIRYIQSQTIAG
jgi:hypothetical protein